MLSNFRQGEQRGEPIVVVFGEPVELGELAEGRPRAALYKKVADRILEAIRSLGEQERSIRARLTR
jgi:1-acyl-sn-glycerol-3-phosphate acyltransferase